MRRKDGQLVVIHFELKFTKLYMSHVATKFDQHII